MAAAYAALASLSNMIDRLQHHPFPPISLDEQQVKSLTKNTTFLEEFLEGYKSSCNEADPLERRIANAAGAAEAAIESYIAHVIMLNGKIGRGEEIVSDEETISVDQIDSGEETSCGDEIHSGEEISCGDEIDSGEETSCGDEIDSGEENSYGDEIDSREETSCGDEIDSGEGTSCSDVIDSGEEISSGEEIDYGEELSSGGEEINCINFYQSLQQVVENMDSIKLEVMGIVEEKRGIQNQLQRNVSMPFDGVQKSSMMGSVHFDDVHKSSMMGFDDVLLKVMDKLTAGRLHRQVIPIMGMGGIGKTTLATNIYAHPFIKEHFDICVWATISQQYNTREILCELLSQATNKGKEELGERSEDELGSELYKYLFGRRILIVLDDMWSIKAWDKIQFFFPDNTNRSRIMVTTRLSNLGSQLDKNCGLEMEFLDEVNSWNLFSKVVFGEKDCPLELKETGKEIVGNCRGLPLSIVVTGGLLRKFGPTHEWWKSIKKNLNSMVNSENHEHCLKVLKMSYDHLPVYLKSCFLYMGVFEEDFVIRVSTLIKLWISEGFIKPTSGKSLETISDDYLRDLVGRNLILVHTLGSTGNIKYCKIHDLLRDLCHKEAQKERFYDAIGPRFMNSQHCRVSTRFLAPSNEYFLIDVSQMLNLRYFDIYLTWIPKFLSSVICLWNLYTLTISDGFATGITFDIWKMPQLRHVHFGIAGIYLSHPPSSDIDIVVMENLQTLVGVTNFKCSEEVVKRIPNIKKLGIKYHKFEGVWPDGDYYCLKNLEYFGKLESLHCQVECTYEKNLASPLNKCRCNDHLQKFTFPRSLKKLTLEICNVFHVKDMLEKIGSLPLLQKLKLWGGWFEAGKWEIVEGQFPYLKYLSLHLCENLECWTLEGSGLPRLEKLRLSFIHMNEIPPEIGEIPTLKSIVLQDCNISIVKSLKKIVEELEELQGELHFHVLVRANLVDQALWSLETTNFHIEDCSCTLM